MVIEDWLWLRSFSFRIDSCWLDRLPDDTLPQLPYNVPSFLSISTEPRFHEGTIESIESVTHDTKLFTVRLPEASFMLVPTGHHVSIKANIRGVWITLAKNSCMFDYSVSLPRLLLLTAIPSSPPSSQEKKWNAATHRWFPSVKNKRPAMEEQSSSWSSCTAMGKCPSTCHNSKLVSVPAVTHDLCTCILTGLECILGGQIVNILFYVRTNGGDVWAAVEFECYETPCCCCGCVIVLSENATRTSHTHQLLKLECFRNLGLSVFWGLFGW